MGSSRDVTPNPWSNNKSCEPRLREGSLKTSIQKLKKKKCDVQINSRPKHKATGPKHFSGILFLILIIINQTFRSSN